MNTANDLDVLLSEAEAHPMVGWSFDWLGGRMTTTPAPWNYNELVVEEARRSPDLLDLGTRRR